MIASNVCSPHGSCIHNRCPVLSRGLISHANLMPIDTSISTDTNMGNVTNVLSVNTSATGLPEGLFLTGI